MLWCLFDSTSRSHGVAPRREHGHDYLRVEKGKEDESASMRQAHAAAHCHEHYSQEADWMINLDIDEYVWSPMHEHLPDFFALEVPASLHIMYVGATRFGWGGQRRRFTYTLEPVSSPDPAYTYTRCVQVHFSQLYFGIPWHFYSYLACATYMWSPVAKDQ